MKTFGYLAIIAIFLVLVSIFIPNSPLYSPLIDYLQNRAESHWGVDIVNKKAKVNVLKGPLTLNDLHVKTSEQSNPTWDLYIKKSLIQISYSSLIGAATVLDNVILDGITFVQVTKAGPTIKSGRASIDSTTKEGQEKQPNDGKDLPKKYTRIKRLVIRNGSFEFNYQHDSGMKESVKAEDVNLVKKDVIFDRKLNSFFRSILDGTKSILL